MLGDFKCQIKKEIHKLFNDNYHAKGILIFPMCQKCLRSGSSFIFHWEAQDHGNISKPLSTIKDDKGNASLNTENSAKEKEKNNTEKNVIGCNVTFEWDNYWVMGSS